MSGLTQQAALVMAGGTGGHVFPALAVAEALRERGVHVHWLGTRSGIEARVVPAAGFDISYLNIEGLRGHGVLRWLMAPFKLFLATLEAMAICVRVRPSFVLGMGGFASGPGGLASRFLARPLVIHEQNAIPGLTNRLLSRIANRVLEAFPNAFVRSRKVFHTGNPLRESILQSRAHRQDETRTDIAFHILIVGGSLGAQVLNETVPLALALLKHKWSLQIQHQCGRNKQIATKEQYSVANVEAQVSEFIDDMDAAYSWADLVICRAGAMTVSELAQVGLASVLVPYPHAVDDHQTANARYLSEQQAAILIAQQDLSPESLARQLDNLFIHGFSRLHDMGRQALALARPDATRQVVEHCLEVAR